MSNRRRLKWLLRQKLRSAGRQVERARREYRAGLEGTGEPATSLPHDAEGRAKVVCRRHAERRAVALDDSLRPHCFDPGSQDCQGCAEDIREGVIETW